MLAEWKGEGGWGSEKMKREGRWRKVGREREGCERGGLEGRDGRESVEAKRGWRD